MIQTILGIFILFFPIILIYLLYKYKNYYKNNKLLYITLSLFVFIYTLLPILYIYVITTIYINKNDSNKKLLKRKI